MINYTDRLCRLMADVVARVPDLSGLDMNRVLVFGRAGRAGTDGPYATCHCLCLPTSEPGYYFWRDRATGAVTRRSEWFVMRSPVVNIDSTPIDYMVSVTLPRFCDQPRVSARKRAQYDGCPDWMIKLDTVVHELYHIDPERRGIRRLERADGTVSANCHGPVFFERVAEMVRAYLATKPDPRIYNFLRHDFAGLTEMYGGVAAATFRCFPSYPRRYIEVLDPQPDAPAHACRIDPLKLPRIPTHFSSDDLVMREFFAEGSRPLYRRSRFRAA